MTDLVNVELVRSARFRHGSQEDLVRMIRMIDPSDIELSLTFGAATSPRFQELYSKITGSREERFFTLDSDYRDTALNIPDAQKLFPIEDPTDILPPGIRRFVADLDELIRLAEEEKIVPLLRVIRKGDYGSGIEETRVYAPKIDNITGTLSPVDAGRINQLIEENIYEPKLGQLKAIGNFARGFRPHLVAYVDIRDEITARDCFKTLDSVPVQNTITYFRIGAEPRDEGGREFYDWRCSSSIQMLPEDDTFTIDFYKPVNARKVEEDFRSKGINVNLVNDEE